MNLEKITINALELACELATEKLINEWQESIQIYTTDADDSEIFTDEAQDIFNEYYDEFILIIQSCSTN
jgi:hypothetical protein